MTDTIVTVAATGLEAKREAAKEHLGVSWVKHPAYVTNPRHSNNQDIYAHARKPYLLRVAGAALADREKNPAFIRAEKFRQLSPTL